MDKHSGLVISEAIHTTSELHMTCKNLFLIFTTRKFGELCRLQLLYLMGSPSRQLGLRAGLIIRCPGRFYARNQLKENRKGK
jgi:hypothetical protein